MPTISYLCHRPFVNFSVYAIWHLRTRTHVAWYGYQCKQKLSYRKQIARQLRTQYIECIHRPKYYTVTLKSRLRVTHGHWRWIMRFQILTAKILFDFLCLWFYNGTFMVCRPTERNLICFPSILIPLLFVSKKLFWRKIKTQISNTSFPIIGMLLK